MRKTNLFKTGVLFILSLIFVSGIFTEKVSAATITATSFGNHGNAADMYLNGYFKKYIKIVNNYYNDDICKYEYGAHGGGAAQGNYDYISIYFVSIDGKNHPAYCIEPGAPTNGSWVYNGESGVSSTDPYWNYLKKNHPDLTEAIGLAIGYTNQYDGSVDYRGARAACQVIIWEFIGGYRDPTTLKVTDTSLREATAGSRFEKYYDLISNQLVNHYTYPSFVTTDKNSTPTITLPYDEEKDEWGQTFITTAGNVDMIDYKPLTEQGICFNIIDDKTIYLYTKNKIQSAQTYTIYKNLPDSLYSDNLYVWTSYSGGDRGQCIVSGADNEAIPLYIKLETEPVYHNITINYYDKYTNETISPSYVSEQTEHNSDYNATDYTTLLFDGYDFIDHIDGDTIAGTLNSNKVINVYYGYNHDVTIEYRDEETDENIAETVIYLPNGEHNSDYDISTDIVLNIDGYTRTKTTGDLAQGVLDTDKNIIVWYKRDREASPETSDILTNISLSGLMAGIACICTLLRKPEKEL